MKKKLKIENVHKYLFEDKILLRLENSIQLFTTIYLFSTIPRKLVIIVLVDLKNTNC